jgi:lipoprotein-releasing system permease protein
MISTFGLVLGVTVLIVVLSVMNGFEKELRTRILGVLPHGMIMGYEPIDGWRALMKVIASHPEVEATAPFITGSALLAANGSVVGVTYSGILPEYESKVSIIGNYFKDGDWNALANTRFGVVMGRPLLSELGLQLGGQVSVVLPEASITVAGLIPRLKRFTIVGTFETGAEVDRNLVLMNLKDAAILERSGDRVDGIRIRSDDLFRAPHILRELLRSLDNRGYTASSWMRMHGNLYEAIQMQKTTMFLLLVLIVAVAAFNVVSSLIMMVSEKKSDIAILRTLGASPATIMLIFILYGTLIGLMGAIIGVVAGVVVSSVISDIFVWIDSVTQVEIMNQYFINYLPSEIMISDLILIALITFLICLTATLYPAFKAAKSNPAEALKYE